MIQMFKFSIALINIIYNLPFLFLGLIDCNSQNVTSLQKLETICLYLSQLYIIRISIIYFSRFKGYYAL